MVEGVLFLCFFLFGIGLILFIPVAIIVLFFPENHKWVIALDKFFDYKKTS